jgi:hypothetical protein
MEDSEVRLRLSGLEERLLQRDDDFAMLQREFARQSQAQESAAAALTDATFRQNARIEALEKRFQELSQIEAEQKRQSEAQESTAAALTDAVVRLSRIEAQFAQTQSVSPPKATGIPPEEILASLAEQPRWFRMPRLSLSL